MGPDVTCGGGFVSALTRNARGQFKVQCLKVRLRRGGDQEGSHADAPGATHALPRGARDDQGHEVHLHLLRRSLSGKKDESLVNRTIYNRTGAVG